MNRMLKGTVGALALAGTLATIATPADAQFRGRGGYGRGYGGYGHYHSGRGGAAVAGGIVGLALGAAIASSAGPRYYDAGPSYYAPPPPPPGYYEEGYTEYCRSDWRWDGYRGRYVRVRYCD